MTETRNASVLKAQLEEEIAGIVLRDGDAGLDLFPKLRGAHFASTQCRAVFLAAHRLRTKGEAISVASIGFDLEERGYLKAVSYGGGFGASGLDAMASGAPRGEALESYEDRLLEVHRRVAVRDAFEHAWLRADHSDSPEDVLRDLQRKIESAELPPDDNAEPSGPRPFREVVKRGLMSIANRAHGREVPVTTPWDALNEHMRGGMWPGLYTLTGSTGSGKSQWALQIALEAAKASMSPTTRDARPVIYVALELGEVEMSARGIGLLAGVPHWKIAYPRHNEFGLVLDAVNAHQTTLASLPLLVEVAPPIGWSYMNLLELADVHRPKLMVIDYAQLVGGPRGAREDVRQTIGIVAKVCRDIARRHRMVVLALCSTARANYARVDGSGRGGEEKESLGEGDASRLSGLGKETGELEYTADCEMVLAHMPRVEKSPVRTSWLAIAKGRGYGPGWVELRFDGSAFAEPGGMPPIATSRPFEV
jgi:replicative DNA helicase